MVKRSFDLTINIRMATYLSKRLLCCSVVLCLALLCTTALISQISHGCDINITDHDELGQTLAVPNLGIADGISLTTTEVAALRGMRDQVFMLHMDSKLQAKTYRFSDFDLSIPDNSIILGIELKLIASRNTAGHVRENKVELFVGETVISENKADPTDLSVWGQATSWNYGSDYDLWSADLSAQTVNDPAFGVEIELSNRTGIEQAIYIDQLAIKVTYQQPMVICMHPCVAVYAEPDPEVTSYQWTVPTELRSELLPNQPHLLNIFAEESPFGEYTICLTKTYMDGQTEDCCRPLVFYECLPSSIGNRIWEDQNANGLQDPGEPGLDGYKVSLYTEGYTKISTVTSSEDGNYLFENIEPGRYFVQLDSRDMIPTIHISGDDDNNSDIENVFMFGSTKMISVDPGENRTDIDLGLVPRSAVCGRVWLDSNANGNLDSDESAGPVTSIHLYDSECELVSTIDSGEDGSFCFEGLLPDVYYLDYETPENYIVSSYGVTNVEDSITAKVSIEAYMGRTSSGNDLGLYRTASLGNYIWNDANGNGLQDLDETGLSEVSVSLYDCNGTLITTTLSDDSGQYLFDSLRPSGYYICISDFPEGMSPTISGADIELGSVLSIDGCSVCEQLSENEHFDNFDAGFITIETIERASIGDLLWHDLNDNGIQDLGEPGVAEVTIELYSCTGELIAMTTSDSEGRYLFQDIEAGQYSLCLSDLPDNLDLDDSQFDLLGCSTCVDFDGVTDDLSQDLRFLSREIPTIDAAAFIWQDDNENGLLDPNENALTGIRVDLYNCSGVFVMSSETDNLGAAAFVDIAPGSYYVQFINTDSAYLYSSTGQDVTGAFGEGTTDCVDLLVDGHVFQAPTRLENLFLTSLGDFVWMDLNANGFPDIDEDGIADVTVTLYDCSSEFIASTVTDRFGHYVFNNLDEGDYQVCISGYESDLAFSFGSECYSCVTLDIGDIRADIDFGLHRPVETAANLAVTLWVDIEVNGTIDSSEPFVFDSDVILYNCATGPVATLATDFSGEVVFEDLPEGDYFLELENIEGLYLDPNGPITGQNSPTSTSCFTIAGSSIDMEIPYLQLAAANIVLGGTIWNDDNRDGMIDTVELPMEDVEVRLYDQDQNLLSTNSSAIDGTYTFENINEGDYLIQVIKPEGYAFTSYQSGGLDFPLDSEIFNTDLGMTELISVTTGETMMEINAGLVVNAFKISGTVWEDENLDGYLEDGENVEEGLIVDLYDVAGNLLTSTVTDLFGWYRFANLESGRYIVGFNLPDGVEPTTYRAGMISDFDSELTEDKVTEELLITDNDLSGINAGYYFPIIEPELFLVGGTVWEDTDRDGLIADGEPVQEDLMVHLLDADGLRIATTRTDLFGWYSFGNVLPGNYRVRFDLPENAILTPYQTGDNNIDSEVATGDTTRPFSVSSNNVFGVNVGYYFEVILPTYRISGTVWEDSDADGLIVDGEPVMAGRSVFLLDEAGVLVRETETDLFGWYSFSNLPSARYIVSFDLPPDIIITDYQAGGNSALDSEVITGNSTEVIELAEANVDGINAGYYYPVSIGDFVWLDFDMNGIQSPDEPGVNNYVITLFDEDNNFIERVFSGIGPDNRPGYYAFSGLKPDNYYLKMSNGQGVGYPAAFQGADPNLDSDITGSNGYGSTDLIVLESGDQQQSIDIGLVLAPSDIGDRVWVDSNGNGIQDSNESGLNGVIVELYNAFDILITSTMTSTENGVDGYYLFEQVYPTEYYLNFVVPQGYAISPANRGGNDSQDSDIDNSNGIGSTSIFLLSPGEADLDLDAGVFLSSTVGDLVWHDRNLNGLQEDNEPGVENVEIHLYKVENGERNYLSSTITDVNGNYSFDGLSNGDYYLIFEPGVDFSFTQLGTGTASELDSNVNPDGTTDMFSISGDQSRADIDAGLVRPGNMLGGQIWEDKDDDGLFEQEDSPVSNISLSLYNDGDELISTVTSGTGGRYIFDNLPDGSYYIVADIPAAYFVTEMNVGSNESEDSDYNNQGRSESYTLVGETVFRNIDLGLVEDPLLESAIVYPNPLLGNELFINVDVYQEGLPVSIKLSDDQGRQILSRGYGRHLPKGNQIISLNVSDLKAGIYYLQVYTGYKTESLKFVRMDRP